MSKGWYRERKRHSIAAKKGHMNKKLREQAKNRIIKRTIKRVVPPAGIALDIIETSEDMRTIYRTRKKRKRRY